MTPGVTWSITGAIIGVCIALVTQAPAHWLANAISSASQHRFVLKHAEGTVWRGSAVALLSEGGVATPTASQVEMALPTRLHWDFAPGWDSAMVRLVMRVQIKSACCTPTPLQLGLTLGWQGWRVDIADQASQWPANWLVGLGSPWNTVQLQGLMQLRTESLTWQSSAGSPKILGAAELTLLQLATPLSTLRPLGSYLLRIQGGDTMAVSLTTLGGGLQLSGNGQWAYGQLQFKGEARAQPAFEAALSNLLNILGQRQGAISILKIG
jgi:general secretion pathway protein N